MFCSFLLNEDSAHLLSTTWNKAHQHTLEQRRSNYQIVRNKPNKGMVKNCFETKWLIWINLKVFIDLLTIWRKKFLWWSFPFLCPLLISKRRNANNGREKVKAIKDIFHEDICQKHNWQKVLFFTLHKYITEQVKNLESKASDHLMMETPNVRKICKNLCWPQLLPFGIPRILSGISTFHYGFPSSFCLTDHLSKVTGF